MQRADKLLYEKGLCKSRSAAQTLIEEGKVYCGKQKIIKPSQLIDEKCELTVTENQKYVSRGGYKLEYALKRFKIEIKDDICADIGASTGGFTDCLLQHGAKLVYAIEGGHGQLDPSLQNDVRVKSIENSNARELDLNTTKQLCDTVVMDVSFISQTLLHKNVYSILKDGGKFITLIKPQFEAGKENIGKHGIAYASSYEDVKNKVISSADSCGFEFIGIDVSAVKGGDGNTEFIAYFKKQKRRE